MKMRQRKHGVRALMVCRNRAWGVITYGPDKIAQGRHTPCRMTAEDSRFTAWLNKPGVWQLGVRS